MAISQRKLAESVGVNQRSVLRAKQSLGITSETLSDEEAELIREALKDTAELQVEKTRKLSKKSNTFVPNVRRIDENDGSSALDMLQDCKERYVKNEDLIQRLQYEIDQQDILMHGNGNGTLSAIPQLTVMEKFQKINISLRNQILSLETEVGRIAEPRKEDDPFE